VYDYGGGQRPDAHRGITMHKSTSMRFEDGMLKQLQRLAHLESLRRNEEVSWASLVRDAIRQYLLAKGTGAAGPEQQAP
jgi:uncharacterized membrane-anchored protein